MKIFCRCKERGEKKLVLIIQKILVMVELMVGMTIKIKMKGMMIMIVIVRMTMMEPKNLEIKS